MIRTIYFSPKKPTRTPISPEEFSRLLRDKRGLLWIDFIAEPDEATLPVLQNFGFHQLAIDDALQQTHAPKIDDWGDYLYIVLNYMRLVEQNEPWDTEIDELDIFLGRNYVITHHDNPIPSIDDVWNACQRDPRYSQDGADHLLYKIIDGIVMNYMPIVEKIDEEIDLVEDQVFDRPNSQTLLRLFTLKRVLLAMRRILLPQREVLNKMARDDYQVIDRKDRIFFRDIYDHLVRLHDVNESLRDLVGGALDTYLSVINNRMNEVMKTLTIITTLFMPLTFVTGFFGMNFFAANPPYENWTLPAMFYATLILMLLTPVFMFFWMRRRTWV
ncbi:MAG: magnesium/cobalt transporter CorA [Anaerolineales bacterium]|nr:magnesium/cobalt transporter CorA [Anaerolineales bacterium]